MDNLLFLFQSREKIDNLLKMLEENNIAMTIGEKGQKVNIYDRTRLVRFGACHTIKKRVKELKIFNKAKAIHLCYNKLKFREIMKPYIAVPESIPPDLNHQGNYPCLARPIKHQKGENIFIVDGVNHLNYLLNMGVLDKDYYLQQIIDKEKEYRIYMFRGGILCVYEKIPDNPKEFYWGGDNATWEYIGWKSYPNKFYEIAEEVYNRIGIDMCAIDLIEDKDGVLYTLEANTAFEVKSDYLAYKIIKATMLWAEQPKTEFRGVFIKL
jgi:glutathione synthase/RimK-type ligase-like ATP-grasp enzyme